MERFVRWLCARVLPPVPYPVLTGPLRGAWFILRAASGEGGGASVYVNRVEPAKTRALLDILKPGHVVFDVGANIGYYTLLASRLVGAAGRVIACEPSPRNIAYLHRHVTLNHATNVTVIPAGCYDRSGLIGFEAGADWAAGHMVEQTAQVNGNRDLVATIAVDELVAASGLRPDVLKIDVEGAELHVLEGASQTIASAKPVVLMGVHSPELRSACTAFLSARGYGEPTVCEEVEGDTELLFRPADVRRRAEVKLRP
jgi:FkbM family methyltransferase